jgi:hypothetical protein
MKKIIVLMCILLTAQISFAQDVDETKNYVYLFNGSVEYGNIVEQGGFFKGKIKLDGKEFSTREVKFYKGETGFYANIAHIKRGTRTFAQRETKGKVNLYRLVQTSYQPGGYTPGFGGMGGMGGGYYSGGGVRTSVTYYYNKGFGEVKKASYGNLKEDLADNQKSMLHLSYYKKARNIQNGCMFGSVASLIGGFVLAANALSNQKPGEKANNMPLIIGFGGSIVFAIVSAVFAFKKHKHMKAAISAYNE